MCSLTRIASIREAERGLLRVCVFITFVLNLIEQICVSKFALEKVELSKSDFKAMFTGHIVSVMKHMKLKKAAKESEEGKNKPLFISKESKKCFEILS